MVAFQPGKEIAEEEIVDRALVADAMGRVAERIVQDRDIAQGHGTDLDQEIDPARRDVGRDHPEEEEDETIAVNIAAAELVAVAVIPVETMVVPIVAARRTVVVEEEEEEKEEAAAVGVTAVATSHNPDAVRVLHLVSTITGTVALRESAKAAANGVARMNNRLLRQGHPWVHQLLGSMIDEVTIVDLILTIATLVVVGTLAVSSLMLDEDLSRTVIIGMMIEKDR